MRDFDIRTPRLLIAVCDLQNIKHAAAQQNIEASAISKRIAQLEASLGPPILVCNRRGVQRTPAGLALLDHSPIMLFMMYRMDSDMAAFTGAARGHGRVVASAPAIAEALLDDVASFIRLESNRNLKVDREEGLSRDIVGAVRDGRAAVGVCRDTGDFAAIKHRHYRHDQLAPAVHAEHL